MKWAYEIKKLIDGYYLQAKRIRLVCDNLNTDAVGSLYKAFLPEEAHGLASRLQVHYTPRHGSWLNVAIIELVVFTKAVPG